MKYWIIILTIIFGLISLPGVLLLTNTFDVNVTAVVENNDDTDSVSNSTTTSSGGGGSSSSSSSSSVNNDNNEETEENTQVSEIIKPEISGIIYFEGYAFSNATVDFSLDDELIFSVSANAEGYFEGNYDDIDVGDHIFTFQAENEDGDTSQAISYAYTVQNESPFFISSILLPPTLVESEDTAISGFSGTAIPTSQIEIYGVLHGSNETVVVDTIQVDETGSYNYELDTENIVYDKYYSYCTLEGQGCGYSTIIEVQNNEETGTISATIFADFNQDNEVNYVDFAFMRAIFLEKTDPLIYDLDGNNVLTLRDFSLLSYQWMP